MWRRTGQVVLPEYTKNAIIEVDETKVRCRKPYVKNVNDELVARSCPRAVECHGKGMHKVGDRRLTCVAPGVEMHARSLHPGSFRRNP